MRKLKKEIYHKLSKDNVLQGLLMSGLNISSSTVRLWITGKKTRLTEYGALEIISNHLNVSMDDLIEAKHV